MDCILPASSRQLAVVIQSTVLRRILSCIDLGGSVVINYWYLSGAWDRWHESHAFPLPLGIPF